MADSIQSKSEDIGKLILRITIGGLLLFHGIFKLIHGVEWMKGPLSAFYLPGFLAYGVYIAEVIAPVLIIVGFWTRPAALIIAFDLFMAIVLVGRQAIFTVKQAGGGWGIELEAFFLLGSFVLFFLGAGKYSITKGQGKWN
ncbi:MAG: DoxX family protein [Bacteroidetes bacterium]|nr:DoxX family protein [Bacteroidota bacterium]MCL5737762.1 DoxX family protein [Bacteroidota bacterium]